MHLAPLIRDLAIILGVAGPITLLFQRIRQPVVLGYILAGILIGPYTPPFQLITDLPSIQTWAELGVVFLMFALGLEFSFRKLARVGGSATIAASAEVLFFLPAGFGLGRLLGWSSMDSLFLGAMLSISSTTIIIKALDELKLKKHRFAELIFGVLIVEDLFAVLLLVALGTIAVSQTVSALALLTAALKLMLVVGSWFVAGYLAVPRLMRYVGRTGNDEMLTILSLGLCLGLVVFANRLQYSTALGAFIMGSIIAESPVLSRVENSIASLKDLFGAIFFVSIGMLIDPKVLWEYAGQIAAISAFTIVGKILSVSLGALASGQSVRNSVQVGFGLAQIGEFSFIIAQLGLTLKATSPFVYPVAVAVSLVTTFATPYLIRVSGRAAAAFEAWLPEQVREFFREYAAQAEARSAGGAKGSWRRPMLREAFNRLTGNHKQAGPDHPFSHLAPWDAHLVTVEIHPNSALVMKKLSELALRVRLGVNVVAIRRGRKAIVPPMPDDLILPKDQLVLLGTDEQVERLRAELEPAAAPAEESDSEPAYVLRSARLERGCAFAGKTIRQSGFREKYQAIVVGLERDGARNINPDSDLELREGDLLWIAGEKDKLGALMELFSI